MNPNIELSIIKTCIALNIPGVALMTKHTKAVWRNARIMLWTHLVRDRHISYNTIAKRFGCTRRNVIWSVKCLEGNMEFQRAIRDAYLDFKEKAGLDENPASLHI